MAVLNSYDTPTRGGPWPYTTLLDSTVSTRYPTSSPRLKKPGRARQSSLRDAMTDLRHWADQNGVDFHQAMDSPYEACLEERRLG